MYYGLGDKNVRLQQLLLSSSHGENSVKQQSLNIARGTTKRVFYHTSSGDINVSIFYYWKKINLVHQSGKYLVAQPLNTYIVSSEVVRIYSY